MEYQTRCVLLAPEGDRAEVRGDLMARPGWIAHEVNEPLAAWAELCLLERLVTSRRAWGLHAVENVALVVVDPGRWPQLPAMLAAARRYLPETRLWVYADGALQELAVNGEPAEEVGVAAASPLIPDEWGPSHDHEAVSPPQISREEIDMLLESEEASPPS